MLDFHLVVSRPTEQPCPKMRVPCLFASGCAPLFWRASIGPTALIVNLERRAVTSEPILCSGEPAPGEWQELVYSEFPCDTGAQRLASGALAVAKDHRDRFIGDRRRQNEKERLIHRACLPCAPRLKRILLKNGSSAQSPGCPRLFLPFSS